MTDQALLTLLDALADGGLHSGEVLAERFGISRAALAKRISQLRDWGVEIGAQAGAGYQLPQPWQKLDAEVIASGLSPSVRAMRLQVSVVTRSASTNSQLLETDAAADPQALFAEHQTAGRGRRGRAWASPFGANWYLSIGWSFPSWPARITTLPLAVAVMVCRALSRAGVAQAGIKWPNDIQVQGQKLAGILIEPRGEAGGACRVVVGVGVNGAMSTAQAETVTQPWVSLMPVLAAAGVPLVERNTVAAMLVDELAQGLAHFAAHGFAPFAAEWRSRDVLRDQPVRIEGSPVEQGTARGVDADGGLLLDTSQGRVVIHAGDVSVRAA